jgi:transposase
MSLHAQPLEAIPELTRRLAKTSFPKGTLAMNLRDNLGAVYEDPQFAHLFPKRGRAATAPWRLALVTVLQAAENLADGQAAEMVRGRLDWKYALSLTANDDGFDPSILSDFRQRLIDQDAVDALLSPILQVCRQRGWLKAGGQQRVDSTMVLATVRRLSSLETVGETIRALLNEIAEEEPDWLLSQIKPDWFDRYVHRFELQRFPKGKQAQEQMQQQVGEDGWHLLQATQSQQAPEVVRALPLVTVLQQVWNQHFERKDGHIRWRDGPAVRNQERVVSPYDQEARESRKRDTEWFGSKVHLTETCGQEDKVHLIIDVKSVPATWQDVQETIAIMQRVEAQDLKPEVMLMDKGYTSGEVLTWGENAEVEIVGPVNDDSSWQDKSGYGLSTFDIDWKNKKAICPQGQQSQIWRPGQGKRGEERVQVYFDPAVCQQCPVKAACTKSEKGGRTLTLTSEQAHTLIQKRRKEQYEKDFQEKYGQRSGVESTMSEGVRSHGMRRSRYVGLQKTQLQMTAIAAAMNLVRIHALLVREQAGLPPRRKRSPSPFARLHERILA